MTAILHLVACLAAASAASADDPAPQKEEFAVLAPGAITFDEAAAAGLPRGSHPHVLSLEQAYNLALIRARAARGDGAGNVATTLEPKRLAELSLQNGVSDFARFRRDFLTARVGEGMSRGFRDHGPGFLDLLRKLWSLQAGQTRAELERRARDESVNEGESQALVLLDESMALQELGSLDAAQAKLDEAAHLWRHEEKRRDGLRDAESRHRLDGAARAIRKP